MKINILTDDKVRNRGFLAEHGLSIFIEHESTNILFDTGQSDVYIRNAKLLKLDLNKTNFIVLSHGHYDHCGGLVHFPNQNEFPKIYVQAPAFAKKMAVNPDGKSYREIGIPWSPENYSAIKSSLMLVNGKAQITSDISLLGNVPSTVAFEEVPKGFFIQDGDNLYSDMIADEQILVFDTVKGLVVFLGCSHPGVINCLSHVLKQFPDKRIDTLVAGMHLDNVSPLRLQMTMQRLLNLDIRNIYPLHCTGISAISEMKRFLGNRCHVLYSGDSFEL